MEQCVRKGLVKSIGVSNFNARQLERIMAECNIKPAVNQVMNKTIFISRL